MKVCPECKFQFGDEHEFCPTHGKRLTALTVFINPAPAGPGATTIFFNPHAQQPEENYERLIGTVLDGRYILLEKMGEGGMGVVFKAKHTVIEKIVAVKILKREVARDRAVLQRFVQEAKAASRIGHWSIVDVTDFGTLPDGSAYQVMEFIGGETLARAIKKGPMWAGRVLPIAAQITRALGAAHDKGIVHRDLKPENVFLVEKNGRHDLVKIVDFGVAKFAPMGSVDGPRLTRAGAVFGTPEYMAPEQAAGRSDNDHRVDVYALGTMMYEMLVGRVPHKGESVVATLAQQMLDPIIPPRRMNPKADVSERVEQVIMTALNKDRDRRYPTMADFWVALEWAAVEQGIVLEPGGPAGVSGDMPIVPTPQGLAIDRISMGGATVPEVQEAAMLAAAAADGGRPRSRQVLFAVLGIAGIAAATVGIAFALRPRVTDGTEADARALVGLAPDASTLAAMAPDAGALGADAATVAVGAGEDAGTTIATAGGEDGGMDTTDVGIDTQLRPPLDMVVSTRPGGGSLYVSGLAAGTDGTTFKRPRGTRLEVRCLFPGNDRWEPGRIVLSFDGKKTSAVCTMTRKTRCVKDLHNPFKDCPD